MKPEDRLLSASRIAVEALNLLTDQQSMSYVLTLPGVFIPDKRLWPRFRNWILRRPPPMTMDLQKFRAAQMITVKRPPRYTAHRAE